MITKRIDYCMEIVRILNFNRAEGSPIRQTVSAEWGILPGALIVFSCAEACTNHLEQVELKRGEKP